MWWVEIMGEQLTKVCTACKIEKSISEFGMYKRAKDGIRPCCKLCHTGHNKNSYHKNFNRIKIQLKKYRETHTSQIKIGHASWYKRNTDYVKAKVRNWVQQNKEQVRKVKREWVINNRETVLDYKHKAYQRVKNNLEYRLSHAFGSGMYRALKLDKAGRSWESLVGYTINELKQHLESKFLPGMTWDNYGKHGWHIDHIIPQDFFEFDSTADVEFQYCWSLDNLQPLWAADNIRKSNKLPMGIAA